MRFATQQVRGVFPGGQLSLRWRGQAIAQLALGVRAGWRPEEGVPRAAVALDTAFAVFSAGKPIVALAVALCEDRGLLDVDAPIAELLPGFAVNGKHEITTRDVLTHRSGLLLQDLEARPEQWEDWEAVRRAVLDAKPAAPRGKLAYSPLGFGWVLAVLIEQLTGTPFHGFVAREIAAPLELPALRFGAGGRATDTFARSYWLAKRPVRVAGRDVGADFEQVQNSPAVLRALVPGAGLVTDAATLAAFYAMLLRGGVTRSGRELVSADLLARDLRREALGFDRSNRAPLAVGRGFLLGTAFPSIYGWSGTSRVYGHAGAFSTLAFADPERELAVAIVTNGNGSRGEMLRRFTPLCAALRKACPKRS